MHACVSGSSFMGLILALNLVYPQHLADVGKRAMSCAPLPAAAAVLRNPRTLGCLCGRVGGGLYFFCSCVFSGGNDRWLFSASAPPPPPLSPVLG